MAVFKYKCKMCPHEYKDMAKSKDIPKACPECQYFNEATLPSGGATVIFEMGDKHRGKQVRKDIQKTLKRRMTERHDRYELAEKIDKHGMDTAKRNGWLKKLKKL